MELETLLSSTGASPAQLVAVLTLALVFSYLFRVNWVLSQTPEEVRGIVCDPVTREGVLKVYERTRHGIDWSHLLPAAKRRRYIVVGGSGVLGCQTILHLLAMGTTPEQIRIIDFRPPNREEFLPSTSSPSKKTAKPPAAASRVAFHQADVTSSSSVSAAFAASWPDEGSANLPLTVFHMAAVIRVQERSPLLYDRCERVNVRGTAHVLAAARQAGAGIFIATSSNSATNKPVGWWLAPWKSAPRGFVQVCEESDFGRPLPPPGGFGNNYSRSKANAERLVCAADAAAAASSGSGSPDMRTGVIRPGNCIYGYRGDPFVGRMLSMRTIPTWIAPWVQNWIHAGNASLGHLLLEDALLGPHADRVAGRPFLVTDDGPPLRFLDVYHTLGAASCEGLNVRKLPPVLMLLVAYVVEAYALLVVRFPVLQRLYLKEPQDPLGLLQPGIFNLSVTTIVDDTRARKTPADGGIGYRPACGTVEGMCELVSQWNEWVRQGRP